MNAPADIRADQAHKQGFQLGELRIDPSSGEMSGPGGTEKLDPKVMNLLVLLAERAGQVVLREDLLARLWPDADVTDDVLSRCIYELRRHFRQAAGGEQYKGLLETLPKRGYRLNGAITPLQTSAAVPARAPAKRRILPVVAAVAATVLGLVFVGQFMLQPPEDSSAPPSPTATGSIAVLPFVDMTEGQDQDWFSDGIAEEILGRLAQAGDLRVISRTSSFAFRDRHADIPEIAAALDVSHVLEGSVRRSGNQVRITAQLIAAHDNSHVWSASYDRELGDLFAIQDEIATAVATALKVTLAGDASRSRVPQSAEAYEKYLQGKFFFERRGPGDMERSVRYLEEAVAIDPGYAVAWAALSGACGLMADGGDRQQEEAWRARQGEAARKAVELDPGLATAHQRLGRYYVLMRDREKAGEHFRRAHELDPEDPLVMGGRFSHALLRREFEEAIAIQTRAVKRDPLSPLERGNLASALLAAGRLDDALVEYRRVLELSPDSGGEDRLQIARIHVLQQRYDEARSVIGQIPEGKLRDYGLALLHRDPGRQAEADAALARLVALPRDTDETIRLAEVYAFRGMPEEAIAVLLDRKAEIGDDGQPMAWSRRAAHLQNESNLSPFLIPLHSDPRWSELMADAEW